LLLLFALVCVATSNVIEKRNPTKRSFGGKLNCDVNILADNPPVTVHHLMPSDINVIAAMGDSVTAANGAGASHLPGVYLEYRGQSWSVGGDGELEDYVTLPNIIKKYKPSGAKFVGYSQNVAPVWWEGRSRLNVAHPGDRSNELYGQAEKISTAVEK